MAIGRIINQRLGIPLVKVKVGNLSFEEKDLTRCIRVLFNLIEEAFIKISGIRSATIRYSPILVARETPKGVEISDTFIPYFIREFYLEWVPPEGEVGGIPSPTLKDLQPDRTFSFKGSTKLFSEGFDWTFFLFLRDSPNYVFFYLFCLGFLPAIIKGYLRKESGTILPELIIIGLSPRTLLRLLIEFSS